MIQCHLLVKPQLKPGKEISLILESFRAEQKALFCLEGKIFAKDLLDCFADLFSKAPHRG